MRKLLFPSLVLALGAVIPSHALFGIGGHWAPAPTLSVKKGSGIIAGSGANTVTLETGESDALQGFGVKFWIDVLPFVDIEVASNVQFATYSATFALPNGDQVPLDFDFGVPLAPSEPAFARIHNDISILYPFLKLPPGISIAKFYGGAGLSYGVATEVLSADLAKEAMVDAELDETSSEEEITEALVGAITDVGLKQGMGFFLQLGAHVKPPIIPIAIYADAKYQFFGFMPDAVEGPSVTLEIGGALAF